MFIEISSSSHLVTCPPIYETLHCSFLQLHQQSGTNKSRRKKSTKVELNFNCVCNYFSSYSELCMMHDIVKSTVATICLPNIKLNILLVQA